MSSPAAITVTMEKKVEEYNDTMLDDLNIGANGNDDTLDDKNNQNVKVQKIVVDDKDFEEMKRQLNDIDIGANDNDKTTARHTFTNGRTPSIKSCRNNGY